MPHWSIRYRKQLEWSWIAAILVLTAFLRCVPVWDYAFPFTIDQARDMVDIREIVVGKNLRLIGPTTSINGVFLGPFYYYLNVIPFWVSKGDPQSLVWWNIGLYQLTGLGIWLLLRKIDRIFALCFTTLFLLMPVGFVATRYFWNAHEMVWMMGWYLTLLFMAVSRPSRLITIIVGLVSGLAMQSEAAMGVLCLPVAVVFVAWRTRKWRWVIHMLLGFGLTLVPQILFELKNNWPMTKLVIHEFSSAATILGDKLTLSQLLDDRWRALLRAARESNHFAPPIVYGMLIIGLAWPWVVKTKQKIGSLTSESHLITGLWFLAATVLYVWLYSYGLKYWYVLGFSVVLVSVQAGLITELSRYRKGIGYLVLIISLGLSLSKTVQEQAKYIDQVPLLTMENPSTAKNQMMVVDWIYEQAAGQPFVVYSHIPSVYDYTYNYLFWWYGFKKFGYQPNEAAYLPNMPEYIKDNKNYFSQVKDGNPETVFLIIEPDESKERQQAWFGNFSTYCTEKQVEFPWGTKAEIRSKCIID